MLQPMQELHSLLPPGTMRMKVPRLHHSCHPTTIVTCSNSIIQDSFHHPLLIICNMPTTGPLRVSFLMVIRRITTSLLDLMAILLGLADTPMLPQDLIIIIITHKVRGEHPCTAGAR